MKLTTGQILAQIFEFWQSQTAKNKKRIISWTVTIIAVAVIISVVININGYTALYSGLSSSEMGEIASRLNEMGIDFKTTPGGTIMVPKGEEAALQMSLASEGYPQSTLNYDIFSGNSGFMSTDYEKKKYLLFQLQNRLQDAIKTINGIKGAIVTISLPEEDSFVLQEDKVATTASVVLDLEPAAELSSQQIKGIEALVSKSVPGLESKNVAIVSNTGEMLNNQYADGSEGNTYSKLELEKTISENIQNRVYTLLAPIFGAENVRIAVNTTVDINKTVSEQTIYSPVSDNTGIVSSQNSSLQSSGTNGQSGGVPGAGANTGVTTYAEANDAQASGNFSETSSVNYLNNQLVEQVQREGYQIKDLTVSVLIGNGSLSAEEMANYKDMIAFAAGVSTEKIAITKADFVTKVTTETAASPEELPFGIKPLYLMIGGGGLFLIIILFVSILLIRKKKRSRDNEVPYLQEALETKNKKQQLFHEEIVLTETREQNLRKQIKEFSSGSPDIVAQLIRTWIKEDEDNE